MDKAELDRLLKLNETLLAEATLQGETKRIYELLNHRAIIKDTIIEILMKELKVA